MAPGSSAQQSGSSQSDDDVDLKILAAFKDVQQKQSKKQIAGMKALERRAESLLDEYEQAIERELDRFEKVSESRTKENSATEQKLRAEILATRKELVELGKSREASTLQLAESLSEDLAQIDRETAKHVEELEAFHREEKTVASGLAQRIFQADESRE